MALGPNICQTVYWQINCYWYVSEYILSDYSARKVNNGGEEQQQKNVGIKMKKKKR